MCRAGDTAGGDGGRQRGHHPIHRAVRRPEVGNPRGRGSASIFWSSPSATSRCILGTVTLRIRSHTSQQITKIEVTVQFVVVSVSSDTRLFYGCSYRFHLSGDNSRERYVKGSHTHPARELTR